MEITQKMQAQIMPKIHLLDAIDITTRRHELFEKYLAISNRKKVYLDEVCVCVCMYVCVCVCP